MKERILVSAAFFYPNVGGYENYIYELYSRLTEHFIIDILVLDTKNNLNFELYKGLNIYRLDSWSLIGGLYPIPKINLKNIKILKKILKNDYIFVNTHVRLFLSSFLGLMIAKYKKTKLVNTEHGNGHVNYLKNPFFNFIAKTYDKFIGKGIIKSAYVNLGVSKATCEFLKKMGADEIYLIPNGVNTCKFRPIDTDLRSILGFNEDVIIITFIGRLVFSKGVQDLITCFFSLKKAYNNLKLLIVGEGDYKEELENLTNNDGDILFLGMRKDIIDILNITDVFVNPSYFEGLPTSVLEAASVGVPIIATDVGGTKEIFTSKMGFLIEEGNLEQLSESIIKIIHPNNLNSEVSRKHIKNNYSWDKIAEQFLNGINSWE